MWEIEIRPNNVWVEVVYQLLSRHVDAVQSKEGLGSNTTSLNV